MGPFALAKTIAEIQAETEYEAECIAKQQKARLEPSKQKLPRVRRADVFWTVARDYELTRGLLTVGLGRTIASMGISEDVARKRWNELRPVKGLDAQRKLLDRLNKELGQ